MNAQMIAHDMRTPLSALTFSILNAKCAGDPETLQRALDIAERNAAALAKMIESLLDPGGELNLHECSPLELITMAIEQIEPMAEQRNQQIHTSDLVDLPSLLIDSRRLVRVLVNLLSNAIRFGPVGSFIRVDAVPRINDGHSAIVFSVLDEGPGIAPQDVDRIFGEGVSFAKGSAKNSNGLGLAVCKELVEAHRGRIWVELNCPKGARLSFSIPTSDRTSTKVSSIISSRELEKV